MVLVICITLTQHAFIHKTYGTTQLQGKHVLHSACIKNAFIYALLVHVHATVHFIELYTK